MHEYQGLTHKKNACHSEPADQTSQETVYMPAAPDYTDSQMWHIIKNDMDGSGYTANAYEKISANVSTHINENYKKSRNISNLISPIRPTSPIGIKKRPTSL